MRSLIIDVKRAHQVSAQGIDFRLVSLHDSRELGPDPLDHCQSGSRGLIDGPTEDIPGPPLLKACGLGREPIEKGESRLHLQHVRIADWKVLRLQLRVEQSLIRLIQRAVAAIVRQHRYGKRPHGTIASRPSLPLEEGGHAARRLMLDDCADLRIVEAYF